MPRVRRLKKEGFSPWRALTTGVNEMKEKRATDRRLVEYMPIFAALDVHDFEVVYGG